MRAEGPKENDSVLPVARVNSGASSSSEVFMAVELSTFTSFGTAEPHFGGARWSSFPVYAPPAASVYRTVFPPRTAQWAVKAAMPMRYEWDRTFTFRHIGDHPGCVRSRPVGTIRPYFD